MAKPTKLLKGQAKVGMRVILMRGKTEVARGVITNIGHDKFDDNEGLTVLRDDKMDGSGLNDGWFCSLHAEYDTDTLYYDAGDSHSESYLTPEKPISWKDRIL